MTKVKEPPLTDAEIAALQERNAARAREAIARLGKRYTCHPIHAPKRQRCPASVLG